MHCRSCEMLTEEKLATVPGVKHSKANFKNGTVEISYDGQRPDQQKIEGSIRSLGYTIGSAKRAIVSRNAADYKDLGIAFLLLAGFYFLIKSLGLSSIGLASTVGNPSSFLVVLLVGLTAGVSTCMALVGGLVLGVSTRYAEKHPEAAAVQKFGPHLYFNLGRVIGFALLGGILGAIGSFFHISTFVLGILTIVVGLVMLLMGLQLTEMFPRADSMRLTLPKFLSRTLGITNQENEYSHANSMVLGTLTFFLPCGFTQAMQLYAISTGNFFSGALVMGIFALGTTVGLLGIGAVTSLVKGIFAKRFFKFAGLLVIFFALFNISNGYNLTGWQAGSSIDGKSASSGQPTAAMENGAQIIKMSQTASGYAPNTFTIRKGVPVRWVIDGQDPYSCSSALVVSKLNISKRLTKGENVVEFTAQDSGVIKFSCAMGMYTGVFNVVDGQGGSVSPTDSEQDISKGSASCSAASSGCRAGSLSANPPALGNSADAGAAKNAPSASPNAQVIKTVYTLDKDIQPSAFTVKAGLPVKFYVEAKDNGSGCMSSIMVPGLYDNPQPLEQGKMIEMDFTPLEKGSYNITCAMGVPRGTITVQ